jgi:hypothetical protein
MAVTVPVVDIKMTKNAAKATVLGAGLVLAYLFRAKIVAGIQKVVSYVKGV